MSLHYETHWLNLLISHPAPVMLFPPISLYFKLLRVLLSFHMFCKLIICICKQSALFIPSVFEVRARYLFTRAHCTGRVCLMYGRSE